ncbi:MAG: sigma-70 family RNA polymerase sigma factor [Oscillospiraceae bacterium]|nr:sigma-70 family RNA polymerase sigma factor [Oscillospiraceae bacterium]
MDVCEPELTQECEYSHDRFIEDNLGLVHSLANRFRSRGIEYEELYSAGCVGLLKAAKGFDKSRGLMFSTYAVPVILGELKRLFRDGGMVKVSRGLKELSLKVVRISEQMAKSGIEPRISDIAERLSVSIEEVSEALMVSQPAISLTAEREEGGVEFDIPVEPPQSKLTDLIALKQILHTLNAEDRRLIALRFWGDKTQTQVGDLMGMSQVQVSRREKKILSLLREKLDSG